VYKLAGAPTLSDERIGRHYVFSEKDTDLAGLLVYEVVGYRITLPVEFIDEVPEIEVTFKLPDKVQTDKELLQWIAATLQSLPREANTRLKVSDRQTPLQFSASKHYDAGDAIIKAIADQLYNQQEDK